MGGAFLPFLKAADEPLKSFPSVWIIVSLAGDVEGMLTFDIGLQLLDFFIFALSVLLLSSLQFCLLHYSPILAYTLCLSLFLSLSPSTQTIYHRMPAPRSSVCISSSVNKTPLNSVSHNRSLARPQLSNDSISMVCVCVLLYPVENAVLPKVVVMLKKEKLASWPSCACGRCPSALPPSFVCAQSQCHARIMNALLSKGRKPRG